MNLYVTTAEIKTFLGISSGDTSKDTKIAMFNQMATSLVNSILKATDLDLHLVTNEVRDSRGNMVQLKEPHVVCIGSIVDDDVVYTQDDEYQIMSDTVVLSDYLYSGNGKLKVTYAAGWNARPAVKLSIVDITKAATADEITIDDDTTGTETIVRGTDWTGQTTAEAEAVAIASAINDLGLACQAFSCGSNVFIQEKALSTKTRAVSSDNTDCYVFSSDTMSIDFPDDIKLAVMLYVSNLMATGSSPKMTSYKIGSKQVNFSSESGFSQFESILSNYRRQKILII